MLLWPVHSISCSSIPDKYNRVAAVAQREWLVLKTWIPHVLHMVDTVFFLTLLWNLFLDIFWYIWSMASYQVSQIFVWQGFCLRLWCSSTLYKAKYNPLIPDYDHQESYSFKGALPLQLLLAQLAPNSLRPAVTTFKHPKSCKVCIFEKVNVSIKGDLHKSHDATNKVFGWYSSPFTFRALLLHLSWANGSQWWYIYLFISSGV